MNMFLKYCQALSGIAQKIIAIIQVFTLNFVLLWFSQKNHNVG